MPKTLTHDKYNMLRLIDDLLCFALVVITCLVSSCCFRARVGNLSLSRCRYSVLYLATALSRKNDGRASLQSAGPST